MIKFKHLLLSFCIGITTISCSQTKVIAHRGFSAIAPENTLASFAKAIELRPDYIEFDLHKTKDGTVVVIHDKTIDRTASAKKKGKVKQMTYHELQKIDVSLPEKFGDKYTPSKIPTFDEVLKLAKGKTKVCIEMKAYGVEEEMLDILNKNGMNDDAIVFSFHYPILAKIKKLNKNIKTLLLVNSINKLTTDYAKVIDVNYIGVGYGTKVTKKLIDDIHKKGMKVFKWTVNKEEQMKYLVDLGIDGLITNYPDKLLKIVSKK